MYRMVDTGTWDDPWFAELDPDGKLLFLYLVTNRRSTSCGAFEITIRAMSFETGIPSERIAELLESWRPRVRWWSDVQIVWLRNFFKHQTYNDKMKINARRLVAGLPASVREEITEAYPELAGDDDRVSIPSAMGMHKTTVTVTETETVSETGERTTSVAPAREDDAESHPKPKQQSKPAKPAAAPVPPNAPYQVFQAFCESRGQPEDDVPKAAKGKQLAVAKRLLDGDYTPEDIASCIRFIGSQQWRTGPWDLTTVEAELPKWLMSGKPEAEPPKPTPIRPGTAPPGRDLGFTNAELEAIGRGERPRKTGTDDAVIDVPWRT